MSRAIRNIRSLHNPLCLSGVGGLAVVRGIAYIATSTAWLPLGGYNGIPHLPEGTVTLAGCLWIFTGVFMWVGMAVRRLFIVASAFMTGIYATWCGVHAIDLFISPDWDSILGLSVYALMAPTVRTLADMEINPPAEPSTRRGKDE